LIFGLIVFTIFYFVVPSWLESKLADASDSNLYPMFESIYGRRSHWFEYLGIACGLIGVYFAARNYLTNKYATREERGLVGLVARILSRNLD